jgi:hypothetical protein
LHGHGCQNAPRQVGRNDCRLTETEFADAGIVRNAGEVLDFGALGKSADERVCMRALSVRHTSLGATRSQLTGSSAESESCKNRLKDQHTAPRPETDVSLMTGSAVAFIGWERN